MGRQCSTENDDSWETDPSLASMMKWDNFPQLLIEAIARGRCILCDNPVEGFTIESLCPNCREQTCSESINQVREGYQLVLTLLKDAHTVRQFIL